MLFDTHAHYYDDRFSDDRDELLSSMKSGGVGYILNPGCDAETTEKSIALAEKYDFIYAAAGIHPGHIGRYGNDELDKIKLLAAHEKVMAIGEIGLDYHYANAPRTLQREAFARQIALADEMQLPIIIHCRDATGDCLDILKSEYKGGGAVMHCFGGSVETAKILLNMGFMIAFGGTLTFKNNVRAVEAVRYIPIENILTETDSPYLAPVPYRGKRNNSLYMVEVARKIAEIKGITLEQATEITCENALRFFKII